MDNEVHVGITIPHPAQWDSICCRLLRVHKAPASPFAECGAVCPARVRGWHSPSDRPGPHGAAGSPQGAIPSSVHVPFSPELRCQEPCEGPCCGGTPRSSPASLPCLRHGSDSSGDGAFVFQGQVLSEAARSNPPPSLPALLLPASCGDASRDPEAAAGRPHVPERRGNRRHPSRAAFQVVVLAESLLTLALVNKEKPKLLLR